MKSKFSFQRVYFPCFALCIGFGLGVVILVHPQILFDNPSVGTAVPFMTGLVVIAGTAVLLYILLQRAVSIEIEPVQLSLRGVFLRRTLSKHQICSIDLLKRDSYYIDIEQSDGVTIQTTDDEEYWLCYRIYRNMPELKRYLRDEYPALITAASSREPDTPADPATAGPVEVQTFAGNYFTSQNGIVFNLIFLVMFPVVGAFWSLPTPFWVMPFPLLPFWMVLSLFGMQLNYFRIDGEFLEIRNHVVFWYRRRYRMPDIDSVIFEKTNRRSKSLRIRTLDFESQQYYAGTLRNRNWQELYEALQARRIPVSTEFPILS